MIGFLSLKYPNINSISDVSLGKALLEYRTYLTEQGVKIYIKNYKINAQQEKKPVQANSYYITMLKQFIEFYEDYYFDGEEWEKDIWDRRKLDLPSDKVNPTQYEYLISFGDIPNQYFKKLTKRYCRLRLNTFSFAYISDIASRLKEFFIFIDNNYPSIIRINQLTREVIEHFLSYLNQGGISTVTIARKITILDGFISTIQRMEWEDSPTKLLIYPEDFPRTTRSKPRFIDEYVLEQLNSYLDELPGYIAAMVLIIQECGMRISELCTLKKGCLLEDKEGDYFLKYYQWKMKKDHVIPITREVAAVIKNQEKEINNKFEDKTEYLFPRNDGSPLKQETFRRELNTLSYEKNIVDRSGNIFRFHAHGFRHTVGTRMINNGVPQHIVQKYLGHESPEMTSRYAHIFDETLKSEFNKFNETLVTNKGRMIEVQGNNEVNDTDLQWFKKNINAQVLPNGYCRLPILAGPCPHANACLDCTHFCTSKKFLQQHEEHLTHTKELLSLAKEKQWKRQIETNARVKERLEQIIGTLKETE